jgi:hypothetical protein
MEYYVIEAKRTNRSPLLGFRRGGDKMKVLQGFPIKTSRTLVLQDLQDTPKAEVTDFLKCTVPVIGTEMYSLLSSFDLPDTDFPGVLFSQPLIDKISASGVSGFKCYRLDEWNDSIVFHDPEMQ